MIHAYIKKTEKGYIIRHRVFGEVRDKDLQNLKLRFLDMVPSPEVVEFHE